MLINDVHLLPDRTGALIWPKARLVAVSDPLPVRPAALATTLKRLATLMRQRRPSTLVWLGSALPRLLAAGKLAGREETELARMMAETRWIWVAEDLPEALKGEAATQLDLGPLIFTEQASPDPRPGEIAARPWPAASLRMGGALATYPCYLFNAKRLLLPAFGPEAGNADALSPMIHSLFRRRFQAILLTGERILTRQPAALERDGGPAGGPPVQQSAIVPSLRRVIRD